MWLNKKGFGLIEVLVGMVIFGMVASTALYFMRGQNQVVIGGTDLTRASYLGKQKMDSLKVIDYSTISAGSDTVNIRYIRSWRVSTQVGKKQVEMTICWPLAANHNIVLYTIIGDDQYKL